MDKHARQKAFAFSTEAARRRNGDGRITDEEFEALRPYWNEYQAVKACKRRPKGRRRPYTPESMSDQDVRKALDFQNEMRRRRAGKPELTDEMYEALRPFWLCRQRLKARLRARRAQEAACK